MGLWWFYTCSFCQTKNQENNTIKEKTTLIEKVPEKIITASSTQYLTVKNNSGVLIYTFKDQLRIFIDSDSVYIPKTLYQVKDSLLNYLNNNQTKELLINGWYRNDEVKNNSDLGIERAQYLRKILTKFGLNSDKINTSSKEKKYEYNTGSYNGGIELVLRDITDEKKINNGIVSKSLYTKFNSREFIPDNTLVTYTLELKNYLINNPTKTVKITGHTDSVGEEADNKIIGIDRATNVMNYFISNGINKNKLKSFSEGENKPISENSTKEGRAKNRRIEINVN
jgi:outer membrane protein OmpA-like peptidoglycan-associated protein